MVTVSKCAYSIMLLYQSIQQVVIPYLRVKLENYYATVKESEHDSNTTSHDLSHYWMLRLYPVLYFVWEVDVYMRGVYSIIAMFLLL